MMTTRDLRKREAVETAGGTFYVVVWESGSWRVHKDSDRNAVVREAATWRMSERVARSNHNFFLAMIA